MGQQPIPDSKPRRFRSLRNHSIKLYRVSQGKALQVLGSEVHANQFDDIQRGICGALAALWLGRMMHLAHKPPKPVGNDPLGLAVGFGGPPTNANLARFMKDEGAIKLHRDYVEYMNKPRSGLRPNESSAERVNFWKNVFAKQLGLRLDRYCDQSLSRIVGKTKQGPIPFRDMIQLLIDRSGLGEPGKKPGRAVLAMLEFKRVVGYGPQRLGHAISLFRLGAQPDGPLFFFDANCGVYLIELPLAKHLPLFADTFEAIYVNMINGMKIPPPKDQNVKDDEIPPWRFDISEFYAARRL